MELEWAADRNESGAYPLPLVTAEMPGRARRGVTGRPRDDPRPSQ